MRIQGGTHLRNGNRYQVLTQAPIFRAVSRWGGVGLVEKATMLKFDELCLSPITATVLKEIKRP